MTTITGTSFSSVQPFKAAPQEEAELRGHTYTPIPAAHAGEGGDPKSCTILIGIITVIGMLIAGGTLWGLGAVQGNPEMLLAGQVLTGIQLAGTGVLLLFACCAGCLMCCFGKNQTGSTNSSL